MIKPNQDIGKSPGRGSSGGTRILITGASGNLGGELARQLSREGVYLSLWGRDLARLDAIARECRAAGAEVLTRSLDLSDITAARAALGKEDSDRPFDMVMLAAGLGDTRSPGQIVEDAALVERLGMANFVAPAVLAAEAADRMARRGRGRIGIVGTAAASHSLPFAAAYSGSKAGLARFADALRLAVKGHGVTVTLVSPGFFAARAGQGNAPVRPGEIPAGIVAARMIEAVAQGRPELVTPWPFAVLDVFSRFLPQPLRDRILLSLRQP